MKQLMSVAALMLLSATAEAAVTRLEITRREPFAAGQAFGSAGAYEKVVGRFLGELDPAHPLNAGIVDLDKAPRNARGRVEYSADFYILKPADLAKGNGALFHDVDNRGDKRLLVQFNSAQSSNDPTTPEHAGNGLLMRHGFTVTWSGWMPGLPATNNKVRLDVPVAVGAASAIEGTVWDEFVYNTKDVTQARLTFKATSTDGSRATLLVRDRYTSAPTTLTSAQWEFIDDQSIRLLPAGTPFRAGAIYQLIYRAANPPVAGIGFAATRDFVSFLRYRAADDAGTANPLAVAGKPAVQRTLVHGTSQSGRYLRDFVYRGFNEDEANRKVFDGVNAHIASARLFLNYRFAQPDRPAHSAHWGMSYPDATFPFAYETQMDPRTGKADGILARCTARGNCPKILDTVSSNEYWRAGQSLVTTDALGSRDTTPPDGVRIYLIAGTHHVSGRGAAMPKGVCATPPNPVDLRPVLRALAVGLDQWVKEGTPPPPSLHPRLVDRSLVDASELGFPAVPGMALPAGPNPKPRFDYGPDFEKGIVSRVLPEVLPDGYRVLVPKVDADGNEVGGIRLPDIVVPTGTATGWAVRSADAGSAGELCSLDGSFVPFARTKAERQAKADPRPSLDERYRDKADYVAKVRAAAAALERARYLLAEDVERIVQRANDMPW
jgi:Alpha/beta hydrolase domain